MRGGTGDILGGMATLNHVFPLTGPGVYAYETSPERSVVAIAERTGKEVAEVILDHLVTTGLKGFFIVPLFNPDLDAAAAMLSHPLTNIGPRRLRRAHQPDPATPATRPSCSRTGCARRSCSRSSARSASWRSIRR